jgi:UDP-2,3-diacylglucosamine pyrophosphatase LpxH
MGLETKKAFRKLDLDRTMVVEGWHGDVLRPRMKQFRLSQLLVKTVIVRAAIIYHEKVKQIVEVKAYKVRSTQVTDGGQIVAPANSHDTKTRT